MNIRALLLVLNVLGTLVSIGVRPSEAAGDPQQLKTACEKGDAAACESLGWLM
jgi:uncharacterized protein